MSAEAHPTFGLGANGGGAARQQQQRENLTLLRQLAQHDAHDGNPNNTFLKATLMDALVTEPQGNLSDVTGCPQDIECTGVTQNMR